MGARRMASPSGARSATAFPLGQVDDLRLGPQFLLQPEGAGTLGQARHLAAGIGEVAEDDGARRAGLAARGDVLPRAHLSFLGQRALPGLLQPVVAEGALLDDALRADRDLGVLAGGV